MASAVRRVAQLRRCGCGISHRPVSLFDGAIWPRCPGWGDTVWLRPLLNELRAAAGEPPMRHADVLRSVRKAMEKLGKDGERNFASSSHVSQQGKTLPLIQFSDDVPLNVVAEV